MVELVYDLDKIPSPGYSYMYCEMCGRRKIRKGINRCDICGKKLIPSSIYEWNLTDALRKEIKKKMLIGSWVKEQFSIPTVNNTLYHYDIYIWVSGKSSTKGCGYLIEVNGPEHCTKYGRERDRKKQFVTVSGYLRPGIGFRTVTNKECSPDWLEDTAKRIVKELVDRANI